MSQDDRALTAKSVAHLCGLFSRDAWHAEHVTHSDLASIVNSFAEVPAVLEAEHCGDFTKTARRALRELAKAGGGTRRGVHARGGERRLLAVLDLLETAHRVELLLLVFFPYKS